MMLNGGVAQDRHAVEEAEGEAGVPVQLTGREVPQVHLFLSRQRSSWAKRSPWSSVKTRKKNRRRTIRLIGLIVGLKILDPKFLKEVLRTQGSLEKSLE